MHAFTTIAAVRLNKGGTVAAPELVKAQQRYGYAAEFVLTADRGITSGFTAIARKTGGIPLFKIY